MGKVCILAVVLLAGCQLPGHTSSPSADVLTLNQARQVVTSYWAQNEKASVANDPTMFDSIEAGPALILDQIEATRHSKLNEHLAQPRPLRKLTVYVPHQSHYPAEFVARIDTVSADSQGRLTSEPFTFLNLFEKPSAGQSWKTTLFVVPALGETVAIAIGNDGYSTLLPINGGEQTVAPDKVGQAVADYLNAATAGLGVDDLQLEGPSVIDAMAHSQRLAIEGSKQMGFTLATTAAPGPGGAHAYRSTRGGAIVFFTVSSSDVLKAARDDACIVQDQRFHLPPEVPAGRYRGVQDKSLALMIAFDPAASKGKPRVLGVVAESYDFVAEPAVGQCIEAAPPGTV